MSVLAKSETTLRLERAIYRHTAKLGTFQALEVTIGINGRERVDFMTYSTNGVWRCYEIKSSLADFRSKAIISFVGHFNYYVMTQELYEKVKEEIPNTIGIYVFGKLKRNAKRQELTVDEHTLMVSFMRSSYRDANKFVSSGFKRMDRLIGR